MTTFTAERTARRNLAQRIERFLQEQEAMQPPTITGWPADQVSMAIDLLDAEDFANGERVMMRVEKAAVFEPVDYVPAARYDALQLLNRLDRVLAY